ncbi:MAG: hypothetical protein LBI28_12615 [Treponema sp.]|jgi:hypothetical protein|nr:hypothetical protein [Treponema sp.]
MRKELGLLFAILLMSFSVWAQERELNVVNYIIDGQNITTEFNNAIIRWESKKVVRIDIYGDNYNAIVYELEIRLHNISTNSIETIILTEGNYTGSYGIYFNNVIFPRNLENVFRCEYYEGSEDNIRAIYFYDTGSESRYAYATLELR